MKRIGLWIACVSLAVMLAAPSALAKVTLTVLHRIDTRENAWLDETVKQFEAANPDIHIEILTTAGNNSYAERLSVLFAGGTAPDIFYGTNDKAGYVLNGWTKDLTPFVQRDKAQLALDDFYPGVLSSSTRNGKITGIPSIAMGMGIYYNKQMFQEAGIAFPSADWDAPTWTWSDFMTVAKKLSKAGADGRFTQVGVSSTIPLDVYLQNGGSFFSDEALQTGIPSRISLNNSIALEAYTKIQELYSNGYAAASSRSGVSTWSGFWEGKMGMDWTGLYKTRDFALAAENGTMNFAWGLAAMPKLKNRTNRRFTDPWFIASTTKYPEEAWRFLKFITGRERQVSLAQYVVFPPSRRSALTPYIDALVKHSDMSRNEALLAVAGGINQSYTSFDEIVGGYTKVEAKINALVLPALNGQKALASALEEAERQANAIIDEMAATWRK